MLRRSLLAGGPAALLARPAAAQPAGRTLRFVPRSDLTILDPVVTTDYATRNHALMVWDQLFGLDEHLQPQPQMVESWETVEDGRLWRFRLREGLKFHDGEPVRGRDCIASIRRWAQRDALGQALLARLEEMTAPDDRSFVIRLKRPFGAMLEALGKLGPPALLIMPERLAATDPARQIPDVIGSGPFRWKGDERIVGARTVYERSPDYVPRAEGAPSWLAGPKRVFFDRVEWTVMPDPGTATSALQQGEVDWWENPPNDLLPVLERNRAIRTQIASPIGDLSTGVFNHRYPPFDNPAIRRIVLAAVNQRDFMTASSGADPAMWRSGVGVFTPGTPMATPPGPGIPPDMAALRQAMRDAGYRGERVVLLSASDKPFIMAWGEVCNDMLRQLGMNVDLVVSDWGSLVQRRANKAPPEAGGWNMFYTSWSGLDMLNPAVAPVLRTDGERGFFGWPDIPEITRLRAAWLDAVELAERQRIAAEVQRVALHEVAFAPSGQFFYKTAFRHSLTDVVNGQFVFWNVRPA